MTSFPIPDMTGWSILDFELAMDGARHVSDACTWLQNQPRSEISNGVYAPGADFIIALGEDWCSDCIDAIAERLQVIRFEDPRDDERRVLLLISHMASHRSASDPLARVIQVALDQSVRTA